MAVFAPKLLVGWQVHGVTILPVTFDLHIELTFTVNPRSKTGEWGDFFLMDMVTDMIYNQFYVQ